MRVFISYARKDGAAFAQRLQEDLKEQGFDAWLDTQRIRGGRVWSTEIEEAIKLCSVMIALMSPGSYVSEICRSEQLLALDRGNRVIPVLAVNGADRPLYLYAQRYRDFTNTNDVNYPEPLILVRVQVETNYPRPRRQAMQPTSVGGQTGQPLLRLLNQRS